MTTQVRRRRADVEAGLTRWFGEQRPAASAPHVSVRRPESGLSSETLLVDVVTGRGVAAYVLRLPPAAPIFADYDLRRQVRVQAALARAGIPVAEVLEFEDDPGYLGSDFLLMERVPGTTLPNQPSYVAQGWLAAAPARLQASVAEAAVELLARIHRLPVAELDLGPLSGGGPDLAGALDYWAHHLDWTAAGGGTEIYRAALDWCRSNLPSSPPASLLWGDPQLGNLVLDADGRPRAVLDWEMASLGPGECDLAWFLVLHELAEETAGTTLPGWPSRAALVARYEAALGRPVQDLHWYEVFAHLRSGAVVLRIAAVLESAGVPADWTAQVPQPRHLARLIGV